MAEHPSEAAAEVVVLWRPGCPYCSRLLGRLDDAGVVPELRNIWTDDAARELVRQHNGGAETVPTVLLDGEAFTNPEPEVLLAELRSRHPELIRTR